MDTPCPAHTHAGYLYAPPVDLATNERAAGERTDNVLGTLQRLRAMVVGLDEKSNAAQGAHRPYVP